MSLRLIDLTTAAEQSSGQPMEINAYTYHAGLADAGVVHLDLISGIEFEGAVLSPAQARSLATQLMHCARIAELEAIAAGAPAHSPARPQHAYSPSGFAGLVS